VLSFPAAAQSDEASMRAALDRIVDVFNQGNVDALDEILAPDYLAHPDESGVAEFKQDVLGLRAAMPDLHASVDPVLAEGSFLAFRFHLAGTFTNPYESPVGPIPPTGQPVTTVSNLIVRFNDEGKPAEEWDAFDAMAFLQALGAVPMTAPAATAEAPMMEMTGMAVMTSGNEEANKATAIKQLDAYNSENYNEYLQTTSETYVHHNPLGDWTNATLGIAFNLVYTAMPDHNLTVDQVVAQGDWVAVAYTQDGTFTGSLTVPPNPTIPGNGNSLHITGVIFSHFNEAGQVDQEWDIFDRLSFLTQLGLIPAMATPEAAAS
jgi:predicted ester cyclase